MIETKPKGNLAQRRAGVILHITSLPGKSACGDLGPDARHFVDFLAAAGISLWQMLPIGPTGADGSPYQSSSAHAGNPRFISIHPLVEKGWIDGAILRKERLSDADKRHALWSAWEGFEIRASDQDRHALARFVGDNGYWLDDYALFRALHEDEEPGGWWSWPVPLRDREPQALASARARLHESIAYIRFEQFLFFEQWRELKRYANARGVLLFGDIPIFVAQDSAEVWAHREFFHLDERGLPTVVAGVPPDYFSATGQRWGNPLYRWDRLEQADFSLWVQRLKTQLGLFDVIRIDHFRGFEAYWEIPATDSTAINGRWVPAPGRALFDRLHQIYDPLPLVAEDLGVITPQVEALRDEFSLPGMRILQFAFSGGPTNPYLPFHYARNSVVYTGTHDNDTTLGWYTSLDDGGRRHVDEYLGYSHEAMPWPLIRCALASRANLAVIPMQDLLGLDGSHRMNLPGTTLGNWGWRLQWAQLPADLASRLRRRLEMYGRLRS